MCTNNYSPKQVESVLQKQGILEWIKAPIGYHPFEFIGFEMELFKLNDSQIQFYFTFPYKEGQDYNKIMKFMDNAIQLLNKELEKYDMERLCYKPEHTHNMK